MTQVPAALAKASSQLLDPAVLRVLVKTVLVTLLIFAGLGWALWIGIEAALQWALPPFLPKDYEGPAAAFFALFLTGLSMWLLFRLIALAVLQLFADEIVAAVEARHYPVMAKLAKSLPLGQDIANSLRGLSRGLLLNALALPVAAVLFFTVIGAPIVFLLVNAVLLGRELTDMAWLRHCEGDIKGNPVSKFDRLTLGAAIAALMMVPFVNLIAPIIGAAAGTHLTQSCLARRDTGGLNLA